MFPADRGCIALMWPVAVHPTNKNELLAWDLAQDPRELWTLDADTIRTRLFSKRDALPEGVTRLPLKSIHLNKSPMVINNLKTLSPEMAQRWQFDLDLALQHAEYAAEAPDMSAIWQQVFHRDPGPTPDVDEDLYGGFVGNGDRRQLTSLRAMTPQKLAAARPSFDDRRLEELVFRYRARNFPATLDETEQARWEEHRAARLFEGEGDFRNIDILFAEIDALSETVDERGEAILGALYEYAEMIVPQPV